MHSYAVKDRRKAQTRRRRRKRPFPIRQNVQGSADRILKKRQGILGGGGGGISPSTIPERGGMTQMHLGEQKRSAKRRR